MSVGSTIKDASITLFSFIFTECKPLIMFCLSVQAYTSLVPLWFFENISISFDDEIRLRKGMHDHGPADLGQFLTCLAKVFKEVIKNPSMDMRDTCIGSNDPKELDGLGLNLSMQPLVAIAYFSYLGMALAVAMCLILMIEYAMHRPVYFGSGRFITFTLHLRSHIAYKIVAVALAVYSMVILSSTGFFAYRVYEEEGADRLNIFLKTFAATCVGLTYSGLAYVLPDTKVDAKFKDDDFAAMTFKRPLLDIFKDSLIFCKDVDHAGLTEAGTGDRTLANKFCGDGYTTVEQLVQFVKKPNKEDKYGLIGAGS